MARTVGLVIVAVLVGAIALGIAGFEGARAIALLLAGTAVGWSGGVIAWAVLQARDARGAINQRIRDRGELYVLHARLNDIAKKVGAEVVDIDDIEGRVNHQESMYAHRAGYEEYRSS